MNSERQCIRFWSQTPDLAIQQGREVDVPRALEKFRNTDWPGLGRQREELEAAGEEACPPGLGLDRDDGGTCHVYLEAESTFTMGIYAVERRRILGILPTKRIWQWTGHGLVAADVEERLRAFMEADTDSLLERVKREASG